MSRAKVDVAIRIVGPDEALGAHLGKDLEDAQRASIAVAFAKETALKALDLERFCRRRRELRLLAGTDFTFTELDLLRRLEKLATASCRVYHWRRDRNFHPKLYVLDKRASRVVYVGSSNLTSGGLRTNVEANVRLEGPPDAPEIARAGAIFEELYTSARATPLDEAFEVRYNELQRLRRQATTAPDAVEAQRLFHVAEDLFLGAYRATVAKQRWLLVTTPENYLAFKHASVWGRRNMNEVAGCEPGEAFLVHVTGGRGIAAMGMFEGSPYYDETPIADPAASELFPHRIGITLLGTVEDGLPTKDLLEPLRPRKKGWFQGYIRKSHALAEDEFRVLREAFEERRRREEALRTAPPRVRRGS